MLQQNQVIAIIIVALFVSLPLFALALYYISPASKRKKGGSRSDEITGSGGVSGSN